MLNEFGLIERLRAALPVGENVAVGIGDDTAVLDAPDGQRQMLVTVDLIAEGSHFTIPPATARQVGRKALAVNLSDIAAMAGRPESAFVAVLLPRSRGSAFAVELFDGIGDLAKQFGVTIAGGDTNIWDGPLVISITVMGRTTGRGAVLRRGAQPGDWLIVTGALGGSLAGRHLSFLPRIETALRLHQDAELHAMLDLSDGLSRDLPHLTTETQLGAQIEASRIPIHPDVDQTLSWEERLAHACDDGEDFELLFAVSPEEGRRLMGNSAFDPPLVRIGEVTAAAGRCELLWPDGQRTELAAHGFEHRF